MTPMLLVFLLVCVLFVCHVGGFSIHRSQLIRTKSIQHRHMTIPLAATDKDVEENNEPSAFEQVASKGLAGDHTFCY
jgi:hypothetical protein